MASCHSVVKRMSHEVSFECKLRVGIGILVEHVGRSRFIIDCLLATQPSRIVQVVFGKYGWWWGKWPGGSKCPNAEDSTAEFVTPSCTLSDWTGNVLLPDRTRFLGATTGRLPTLHH